jgi:hypothetical protein
MEEDASHQEQAYTIAPDNKRLTVNGVRRMRNKRTRDMMMKT